MLKSTKTNKQFTIPNNKVAIRSKSVVSLAKVKQEMISAYENKSLKMKPISRAQSALKNGYNESNINKMYVSSVRTNNLPKVSKGKLHLGKMSKPQIILPNQARNNPWGAPIPINQSFLQKKGLMEAVNMGILPKTLDFTEILNNKYNIIKPTQQVNPNQTTQQNDIDMFVTNLQMPQTAEQPKQQQITERSKSKKKKRTKKVTHKKEKQLKIQDFLPKIIYLKLQDKQVVRSEQYYRQLKKSRLDGYEIQFRQFIRQIQNFAIRYRLKKFQFQLDTNFTHKMTDYRICHLIQNYKAKGVYTSLVGGKQVQSRETARMILYRFRYKISLRNLRKIENIKKFYKVKKFYEEMSQKRVDYLKFKFGSFIETQRRYIQQIEEGDITLAKMKYQVEIHIPLLDAKSGNKKYSYYKLRQRNNIQLTSLFQNSPQQLILLTLGSPKYEEQIQQYFGPWMRLINSIKGYHPKITIICANGGEILKKIVNNYDEIYYGFTKRGSDKLKKLLKSIKNKNSSVQTGLICAGFPNSIVKLVEMFEVRLCGGCFIQSNIKLLRMEQQQQQQQQKSVINSISQSNIVQPQNKHNIIGTIKQKLRQLNGFVLTNQYFNNRILIKSSLLQHQIPTPQCIFFRPQNISIKTTKIDEFMLQLSQAIIRNKETNHWIFKLNNQLRFSRGIAILETDNLKIIKQKKKQQNISMDDIVQLAKILLVILKDKLSIPQQSLHDRIQFIQKFFQEGGYVQQYKQNMESCCLFGNLHPNGYYQHLGTYDKIYTDQQVNCSALYPSKYIKQNQLLIVEQYSRLLFKQFKIYGKITFQLIYHTKTQQFLFLDIVPHIEQYSSLYYMYTKYLGDITFNQNLDVQEMDIIKNYKLSKQLSKKSKSITSSQIEHEQVIYKNRLIDLKRTILYCPFIDNNGNKFNDFQSFQQAKQNHKLRFSLKSLEGVQFLYLNLEERLPDALSIFSMADNERKAYKHCLDALNFLLETGEKANKFDKKVQRRKYDCIFINDIIWKLRQIKKKLDNAEIVVMKKNTNKSQN